MFPLTASRASRADQLSRQRRQPWRRPPSESGADRKEPEEEIEGVAVVAEIAEEAGTGSGEPGDFQVCRQRARQRARPSRHPLTALREEFALLRECGVTGDDAALAALLEEARMSADRAVSLFLERSAPPEAARDDSPRRERARSSTEDIAGDLLMYGDASSNVPSGMAVGVSGESDMALEGIRAASDWTSPQEDAGPISSARAVKMRHSADQKAGKRKNASRKEATPASIPKADCSKSHLRRKPLPDYISILKREGEELPVGLRFQTEIGDCYEVDVTKMRATDVDRGSIRKIRREKPGVWRYDKKGRTWGIYSAELSIELDRIFLARTGRTPQVRAEMLANPSADVHALPHWTTDPVGFSVASLEELEVRLAAESLSEEAVATACDLLFSAAEAGGMSEVDHALELLLGFAARHNMRCDISHARRAGLVAGSMRLLRAVLETSPGLSLVGADVFDRKYPKLSIQDVGRKNCIRCLLARGMQLGASSCAPQGKLLRKVEADAAPQWTQRCLEALTFACPQLPDLARDRICAWLGQTHDGTAVAALP